MLLETKISFDIIKKKQFEHKKFVIKKNKIIKTILMSLY